MGNLREIICIYCSMSVRKYNAVFLSYSLNFMPYDRDKGERKKNEKCTVLRRIPTPGVIRATIPYRLDADKRYTGVVAAQFPDVHFIEEGLCGRTICSTDPIDYSQKRRGNAACPLATHDPLDVIVIMLGTNDSKAMYGHSPFTISDAMDRTIKLMQSPLLWSNTMQKPQILLVCTAENGRKPCRQRLLAACLTKAGAALIHALPARFRTLSEKIRLRLCGRLGCHGGKVLGPDSSDRRGARRARQGSLPDKLRELL